jgi:hypothetical protein
MTFDDDDDYLAIPPQPVGEPPPEDEDSMHEAIEQYLRNRRSDFMGKDGSLPSAEPAANLFPGGRSVR